MNANNDSLPSEPPTPPTRTSEALRSDLRSVNSQLAKMKKDWEHERQKLLGEKAVLQDAANRLNVQVRTAENEARTVAETKKAGERLRLGVEGVCACAVVTRVFLTTGLNRNWRRLNASSQIWKLISRPNDLV
jgi:hypothetical protein